MAIEYGYRRANGQEVWDETEAYCRSITRNPDYTLIAREVGRGYVVSIRN